MSHSARKRVARCVGYSAVAATLAALAATTVPLVVPGCGQDGLIPQDQPDEQAGLVAEHQDEQIDQLELRRGVLSDEGVFLIYDAAMPAGATRSQPGYLAWWTEIGANEAHVYGRLVLTGADVGQALLDLERDLSVDIDALAAEDPFLSEAIDEALLAPPDGETSWRLATYGLAAEIMGFPAAPDDPNSVTPVYTRGDDCCPLASVKAVLRLKAPEAADHPYKAVTIAMALCTCGGRCGACNDHNPCTDDWCDHAVCYNDPIDGGGCPDDGNECTEDVCDHGACTHPRLTGPECEDDDNSCTLDVCDNGACTHQPQPDGAACADEPNPCTRDVCVEGGCEHQPISGPQCQDEPNPCTDDVCVEGGCQHLPNTGPQCEDDGNKCTKDVCVEGGCEHQVIDPEEYCDDEDPCTADTCICGVGCVHTMGCADADPCTADSCHPDTGDCQHGPLWPPYEAPESCESNDCDISLGAFVFLLPANDDDDNDNGVPDYLDTGPVLFENDLKTGYLNRDLCPLPLPGCGADPSSYTWTIQPKSQGRFNVYLDAERTQPAVDVPWGTSGTVYVEGRRVAGIGARETVWPCGAPADVIVECQPGGEVCRALSSPVRVIQLTSLEWQVHAAGSNPAGGCLGPNPGLDRCPNNGGRRIFPDRISPDDEQGAERRLVDLVAKVEPPASGVWVHFEGFDVDDPFDQLHGPNSQDPMPNVHLIDGDTVGGDNRPVSGSDLVVGNKTALTDEYGQARLTLTVTMQPGNNYRVAASLLVDAREQVHQADADALNAVPNFSGYKCPVVWSEMLTVWRHLWIERDTMEAPNPANLRAVGEIESIFSTPGRPGLTTIRTPYGYFVNFTADLNNYEEGILSFNNCPAGVDTFPVVESYPGDSVAETAHQIIILGTPGACATVGTVVAVSDDDDAMVLGTPSSPRFPNGGGLLADAFKPAYIMPVYAGAPYDDAVPFEDYFERLGDRVWGGLVE